MAARKAPVTLVESAPALDLTPLLPTFVGIKVADQTFQANIDIGPRQLKALSRFFQVYGEYLRDETDDFDEESAYAIAAQLLPVSPAQAKEFGFRACVSVLSFFTNPAAKMATTTKPS